MHTLFSYLLFEKVIRLKKKKKCFLYLFTNHRTISTLMVVVAEEFSNTFLFFFRMKYNICSISTSRHVWQVFAPFKCFDFLKLIQKTGAMTMIMIMIMILIARLMKEVQGLIGQSLRDRKHKIVKNPCPRFRRLSTFILIKPVFVQSYQQNVCEAQSKIMHLRKKKKES